MTRARLGIVLVIAAAMSTGCARFKTSRGVETSWRQPAASFENGVTTAQDVLDTLGPPSQIIPLKDGSVYYYLHENGVGRAMILLVYNTSDFRVTYDRAIFFFDDNDLLRTHSLSTPRAAAAAQD